MPRADDEARPSPDARRGREARSRGEPRDLPPPAPGYTGARREEESALERHTLARAFSCEGIGLHGGAPACVRLLPAAAGSGLVLVRSDLRGAPTIEVGLGNVRGASFATTLGSRSAPAAEIATVEHLLAALACARVDDARIEVDGPEVPVLDGSAAPFCRALADAGVAPTEGRCRSIVIDHPIAVEDGRRRVEVEPACAFSIDVEIDFAHPAIGRQSIACEDVDFELFAREIAPARTFGFVADVESLRASGRAAGASLDNTIVLDDERVMNEGGLRFADEFVRHKALDLIGDLALLGAPLRARVRAQRAGHAMHHRLVAAILARPDDWHWAD